MLFKSVLSIKYVIMCLTALVYCGFLAGRRPERRRASSMSHWSWPLIERNSSAAHFSRASIVAASTRSTKLLVLDCSLGMAVGLCRYWYSEPVLSTGWADSSTISLSSISLRAICTMDTAPSTIFSRAEMMASACWRRSMTAAISGA